MGKRVKEENAPADAAATTHAPAKRGESFSMVLLRGIGTAAWRAAAGRGWGQ